MKHILLLGHETSLGEEFKQRAQEEYGHIVSVIDGARNYSGYSNQISRYQEIKGPIHWVVNCHGTNQLDRIGETPYIRGKGDETRPHLFTNSMLVDNVAPIYWLVNSMVNLGLPAARVLSVASQTYRIPQTNTAFYCASKAALVQMSKVMARELASQGWVINCLAPGKIEDTAMAAITDKQVRELRDWTEEEAEQYARRNIPMGRYTNREEVCDAMFRILELPPYINGTCIDMTGGA